MHEVSGGHGGAPEGGDAMRRERLLARAFVRLADTLADEFDVVEFLQSLSVDSVEIIGAEAASVMLVNARGERFCNEQVYGATLGQAMVEGQGGKAWLVLDSRLRWQSIKECLFGGLWAFQALPALAARREANRMERAAS